MTRATPIPRPRRPRLNRAALGPAALACTLLALGPAIATAQDVKELIGRTQQQSQQKAVEDLIRKLQPESRPASPPVAEPTMPPPAETPQVAVRPPVPEPGPEVLPPRRNDIEPTVIEPPAKSDVVAPPARVPDAVPPAPPPAAAMPAPAAPIETPRVAPPPAAPVTAPVQPAPATALPASPSPVVQPRVALPSVDIEIYFDLNSHAITPRAAETLKVLALALSDARLASARFLIGGHTDRLGKPEVNLWLSQRRAEAVRRFLIERHGIAPERLVSQGFGDQRLKSPGNPTGLENRRVQIVNLSGVAAR